MYHNIFFEIQKHVLNQLIFFIERLAPLVSKHDEIRTQLQRKVTSLEYELEKSKTEILELSCKEDNSTIPLEFEKQLLLTQKLLKEEQVRNQELVEKVK